ncbi:MAG: HlyD family efflux transporter periplasmic adaptor subunit [Acetobacter sp.]|nr:HlyD family efflux transporter periplasmic adaptor subunit [Acetobacter sp.]
MADTSAPDQQGSKKKEAGQKPHIKIILLLVVAGLVIAGVIYWFMHRYDVETDDAFTAGRTVSIVPHVSGYVTELLINDNQFVHAGDVLLRIDPRDWQAAVDKAQADVRKAEAAVTAFQLQVAIAEKNFPARLMEAQGDLGQAKAQLFKAQTDYNRQHSVMRAATSAQDIDYSKAGLDNAKAQVLIAEARVQAAEPVIQNIDNIRSQMTQQEADLASARANLVQAQLNLGWTVLRAPHDGWISQRNVEQGDYVAQGQSLVSVVEPEVWVVANYKETQIGDIRPGQKVDISVDAYPSHTLKGHVDSLQKGTGAVFSAFPPENATGNYVKIVQRVPVKIMIDSGENPDVPLALGLSVEPVIHTDTTPSSGQKVSSK